MKVVTSSRRQIVMAVLLGLAALGAVIRHWAPNPSLSRDVGTLLLVLWLPAVGNLVAFVMRKLPRRPRPPTGFAATSAFVPHLQAELRDLGPDAQAGGGECLLVVGKAGFRARTAPSAQQALSPASARTVDVELLRPSAALPRLQVGTSFGVLHGTRLVGSGRVLSHLVQQTVL